MENTMVINRRERKYNFSQKDTFLSELIYLLTHPDQKVDHEADVEGHVNLRRVLKI